MSNFAERFRQEGVEQGMQQGMEQGMQQGEAAVLLRLMERKFGTVSAETYRRITEADAETLLDWSERILTAQTPEEVLH